MLLFSTILPINDTLTKDGFIQLAIDWNQRSPHEENVIPDLVWDSGHNVRFGNDKLWMQVEEYRNQNTIAIRYEKTGNNGVVWDADYVMNFTDMKMSAQLDRSYLEEAQTVDSDFSIPAFIDLLVDGGYLKSDDDLEIVRKPVFVDSDNLQLAADVINGVKRYRLPVVYISKTYQEKDPVDVWDVARRLKGIAHVLVQKNSWSGAELRRMTDSKNEYNGAIGIYFPNPAIGHLKYLHHDYPGSDVKLADKIVQRVLRYSTSQRMDMLYTWTGVNNALLRDRYSSKREELAAAESARKLSESAARLNAYKAEMMRQQAEETRKVAEENEELVESVSETMTSMRQQIKDLTRQIDALKAENHGLQARLNNMSSKPILYLGDEEEFFSGEIKEFILEAVWKELKNTKAQTRKADVLNDILRSNGGYQNLASQRGEKLKNGLRGYSSLSGPQKRVLEELGFTLSKEGGHYKAIYYGDGRYRATLAATPSDKRAGMNAASEIICDMF